MLQGLYAAASGMEAQQTQMDAISGDIANMDTPGYQSEDVGFRDLLFNSAYGGVDTVQTGSGATASVIGYNQSQGTITPTGQPLDVALDGPGYLEVKQADGTTGLTRDGVLQLDARGQLSTAQGMLVQPPVTVPPGTQPSAIRIAADGTVSVGKRTYGRIAVVSVPAPDQLRPSGNGVFSLTAASGALIPAKGTTIQQGSLEQSNVDLNESMSNMMLAEQGYDLASKAIDYESQMAQIASTLKQ